MSIPFTQYVRPRGEPIHIEIDIDSHTDGLARELIGAGYAFEIEVLTLGGISMDCSRWHDGDVEVIAMELCSNGPAVVACVERLVHRAYVTWKGVPVIA